jgi:hypothetical protein
MKEQKTTEDEKLMFTVIYSRRQKCPAHLKSHKYANATVFADTFQLDVTTQQRECQILPV